MEEAGSIPLTTNGIVMPQDFPSALYEEVHSQLAMRADTHKDSYSHYAGAWNAVSYRYQSLVQYGDAFSASVTKYGAAPDPQRRFAQERDIFGFFSNGFSVFESYFYAMFSIASILEPSRFPISSPKDQRRITPKLTTETFANTFAGDPLLEIFNRILTDSAYLEWQEVRNILTHRSAPGRTFFVTFGGSEAPSDEWKIRDIPLDKNTTSIRRAHASRLITQGLQGTATFVRNKFA